MASRRPYPRLSKKIETFRGELSSSLASSSSSSSPVPYTWYEHDAVVQNKLANLKPDLVEKYRGPFEALLKNREFSRVVTSHTSTGRDAYDVYERKFTDLTFRQVSMVELKYELLLASSKLPTNKDQESMLDTFFSTIPVLSHIDRRFLGVSKGLYWDSHTASLASDTASNRCFLRLFDTSPSKAVGGIQFFPESIFDKAFSKSFEKQYREMLSTIIDASPSSFDDIAALPAAPNLRFILEWADDDLGLYWDILTMFATFFMEKKPLGAYFLIGLTRNGKSSAVALINTLLGTRNVGNVCCSDLGNYHKSATLRYVMANAPDDEDDDITKYQKDFKQLAGHKAVAVDKMHSQEPFEVPGSQFTMVFPMNTIPTWKGSSAPACNKRTIIIPFNRDFSKSDKAIGDFETIAFTPKNLCTLGAHAMALATIFTTRPKLFGYSQSVRSQMLASEQENNSVSLYSTAFHKYFEGFASWKMLYDDYRAWCNANEVKYSTRPTLELAFQQYRGDRCRSNQVYQTENGTNSQKARHIRVGIKKRLLMPDAYFPELNLTAETIIDKMGQSVVEVLDTYLQSQTEWMRSDKNNGVENEDGRN